MEAERGEPGSPAMTPERWRQIERLLEAALERTPGQRAAYLAESCGSDDQLRREVESLLAGEGREAQWLEQPLAELVAPLPAALTPGTLLGPYRVLEAIGAGGMGQVYRARDERLNRTVALKALPPEGLADSERRRRFLQEARAASAIQHPNIVTFYDLAAVGNREFLIMEYVAGKTLGQLIPDGGLPLRDVLGYAVQIADGLAAAHSAAVTHRDLKPVNIMVTEAGQVKLLDFGLAKLTQPAGTPRIQESVTQTGTIVGTVAYMSPEQAEGRKLDVRSDIFSFGVVLHEMLTGRRLFQRGSVASTLAAIVHDEPPALAEVAPLAPRELDRILRFCLRKEPGRRFQCMADVKLELEAIRDDPGATAPPLQAPLPIKPRLLSGWRALVAGLLLGLGPAVLWWLLSRPRPAAPQILLSRLTWDAGLTRDPALTADGKLLAYASDRGGSDNLDIWVQQVGGGESIRLTRDTADDHQPCFSPDGTAIAFRSEREGGAIYLVPALGGEARRIAPEGRNPRFSPDGKWIAYWTGHVGGGHLWRGLSKVFAVPVAGGLPKPVQAGFAGAAYPVWAPDGKHLLFVGNRTDDPPLETSLDWWVAPLDGGMPIKTGAVNRTRAEGLIGASLVYPWVPMDHSWLPGTDSVIFSARQGGSTNLWRIGISPTTFKAAGSIQRLTSSAGIEHGPALAAQGGAWRLAFSSLSENLDVWSLPLDAGRARPSGEPRPITASAASEFHPRLSADGSQAVFVSARPGVQDIWLKDLSSGRERRITFNTADKYQPALSPDGTRVAYSSNENGSWNLYVAPVAGGAPELVCEGCGVLQSWSRDGSRLFYHTLPGELALLRLASRATAVIASHPAYRLCQNYLSPDERWIVFMALAGGRSQVYVAPFQEARPITEREWIPVTDGRSFEDKLHWGPDSSLIYFHSDRDGFRCLWAQRLDAGTMRPAGNPIAVFHSHSARRSILNVELGQLGCTVGRDRMLFGMKELTGDIWMAEFR